MNGCYSQLVTLGLIKGSRQSRPAPKPSWRYLLDSGGGELYMSSRLYNRTGDASGSRRSRQAKRGAAVLPDSAGLERADPVRRAEAGRANAFGAGNRGAAGCEPDEDRKSTRLNSSHL